MKVDEHAFGQPRQKLEDQVVDVTAGDTVCVESINSTSPGPRSVNSAKLNSWTGTSRSLIDPLADNCLRNSVGKGSTQVISMLWAASCAA
jgi:hypothetical protein